MDERLARQPHAIRTMFGMAARRYDLLNRLMSLRLDVRWRAALVAALAAAPPGRVLDVAAGTGDVALALDGRPVTGSDFTLEMLALARRKARRRGRRVSWLAADALSLPVADGSIAGVTVAFGVRNFASLDAGLAEIRRVLCPGGVLGVLELHRPRRRLVAGLIALWNGAVVRTLGRLLSHDGDAYSYLPASVATFVDREGLQQRLAACGFEAVTSTDLMGGIAGLTLARRGEAA
jgi:demethylmenaquinone methyltransferase/2-methoxy-6-polyprenyl-1,4-benzoquinol methylase